MVWTVWLKIDFLDQNSGLLLVVVWFTPHVFNCRKAIGYGDGSIENMYVFVFQDIMAGGPVNVNEFQELAREALPKMDYDFYAGGAEDQHTLKENVEAFRRIT